MANPGNIRASDAYPSRSAELYANAFEWADAGAIEGSLSVNAAYNAQMAALWVTGSGISGVSCGNDATWAPPYPTTTATYCLPLAV